MTFVIQSGVIPVPNKRGRKPTEFPLDQMNVGDSFLIECDISEKKQVESWRRKLLVAKKRFADSIENGNEFKFTTAVVSDEFGTGLRVWRSA